MHPAEQLALIIGRIYRSGLTTTSGGNLSIMDENGDVIGYEIFFQIGKSYKLYSGNDAKNGTDG